MTAPEHFREAPWERLFRRCAEQAFCCTRRDSNPQPSDLVVPVGWLQDALSSLTHLRKTGADRGGDSKKIRGCAFALSAAPSTPVCSPLALSACKMSGAAQPSSRTKNPSNFIPRVPYDGGRDPEGNAGTPWLWPGADWRLGPNHLVVRNPYGGRQEAGELLADMDVTEFAPRLLVVATLTDSFVAALKIALELRTREALRRQGAGAHAAVVFAGDVVLRSGSRWAETSSAWRTRRSKKGRPSGVASTTSRRGGISTT